MPFVFLMLLRILFGVSMVFVIGYVFGNFAQKPALATLSRIAVIVGIVAFIAVNIALVRFAFSRHNGKACGGPWRTEQDSVAHRGA